jgi:GH25 family lysozyme M1 (1,4-beta-N-acetylmuramidase)
MKVPTAESKAVSSLNAVIDLSHYQGAVDLNPASGDGILGVIHKATQGTHYADPLYIANRANAAAASLLWGAYHFGVGGDGVGQADHFLNVVGIDANTLVVLDLEANPQGPSMTLEEARAFVTHVYDKTGRWPGLYAGHYLKELLGTNNDPVLAKCWFWLSQYGPTPVVPVNWQTWTLWQYTDGGQGLPPHTVAGIGRCDRSKFNGSESELRNLWLS